MHEGSNSLTRRGVLKKSALATGALVLGGTTVTGTATAGIGDGRVLDFHLNNVNYDRDKGDVVAGHVHDASPYENDGEWLNWDVDPIVNDAPVGNGYRFRPEDEVKVTDAEELNPGSSSWSVAFWANPSIENQDTAVVSKRKPSSPFPMYMVGFCDSAFGPTDGGQKLAFRFTENARDIDRGVYSTDDVIDGKWHHFAAVADRTNDALRLFVDGGEVEVNVGFDAGGWPDISNSESLYLGQDNGGGRLYDGMLDEVRIYNRALTSAEIADLAAMDED